MSSPGRPEGEFRSAQHEGTPMNPRFVPSIGPRRVARGALSTALSTVLSAALSTSLAVTLAALPATGGAVEAARQPLDNAYAPFVGEPFFLLSDATFGSSEPAQVRLEVNAPEALQQAGGVDVLVYRIPEPLAFLQRQKNLHRVQVQPGKAEPGLANALTHLWDSWVVKSRLAWQKLFSSNARQAVTKQAPGLKTPAGLAKPSTFEEPPQYRPLPGLPLVERFRYPVQAARPIEPPKDLKLAGSSSEFIKPSAGNVFVPVGRRAPGLYLVEAIAGQHRATTLMFVADTVALTKASNAQMLVWAAARNDGAPVPKTRVVWTDGLGVLKSGATDDQGVARLDRPSPEQSYVFGEDPKGGVFISENFYYDSEVYTAKVYAVTDRPLYRPGDWVQVKVTGREFRNARDSVAMKDADLALAVLDPSGQVVATQSLRFSGAHGADGRFALPDNAAAGGYELRLTLGDDTYTAAFRVADYQKPHFDIALLTDKADHATGEPVAGQLQLHYPDGKPVVDARISLTARAQMLSMVDGELDDGGPFAVKLSQNELKTDGAGVARFSLPAATEPSRYVLTALATDGAAYRVRTSKEVLVERAGGAWRLTPDRQFSKPGEAVRFSVAASRRTVSAGVGAGVGAGVAEAPAPVRWDWIRLENGAKASGAVSGKTVDVAFAQSGTYTLNLRDDKGRIVAATAHWVSGDGLKAPAGSIGMVFDRARYKAGDTAEVLVSFPEPIDHALLTLERDRVEAQALLGKPANWVRSERLGPTQWKLTLEVRDDMAPNMTLAIAYVRNGDYVFRNQGLLVEQPGIAIAFRTTKPVYAPGETVTVDVSTSLAGQPLAAEVAVGVVDEMIYVLQPEIAPSIVDFFFHPRRNNVRTAASLSFIGYDLATSKLGEVPSARQVNERAVKVLERPRRDNVDTAAWLPRLATDATGQASFSFTMPDSLTRWRITGRATEALGHVGQQVAWLRSDKPFYAKWTSPAWQREGDKAQAAIALFNQTGQPAQLEWEAQGAGVQRKETVTAAPGASYVDLPLAAERFGTAPVRLTLRQQGRVVDQLDTPLQRLPVGWRSPREAVLDLSSGSAALSLPADATRVRIAFSADKAAGAFSRSMDALIDFPFGCVEQTASRMLPLSIALQSLTTAQQPLAPQLTQRLATARLALAQMAGPEARFGWWGRGMGSDAFLTAYAYYADWRATLALKAVLPDTHWQRLLDVYAKDGVRLPPLQRALALSWMQEIGLPVRPMAAALVEQLLPAAPGDASAFGRQAGSLVMTGTGAADTRDLALVLAVQTAAQAGAAAGPETRAAVDAAVARLAPVDAPFVQALLLSAQRLPADRAPAVLDQVRNSMPTFDRAQTLLWLQRSLAGRASAVADLPAPGAPWERIVGPTGDTLWQLPAGAGLPTRIALPDGAKAAWAFVSYESAEAQSPALAAAVERTLWRVVTQAAPAPGKAASAPQSAVPAAPPSGRLNVKLEKVAPGTPLDSNALYLDELKATARQPMRWALIEAALPPGAAVESSTWGLDVADGNTVQVLERARHEPTAQGYAVPVESLAPGAPVVVRHLVRFSQRGQFVLPATRLYRMYEPEAKASDTSAAWTRMDVR